jgi:hypothetical protein
MASYPVPKQYPNNSIDSDFNINDFNNYAGNATLEDLLNYANLYNSNLFYASNFFTSINFSDYLNGISPTVFNWINNLATYYYDTTTSDVGIGSNVAISGSLAAPTVNKNSVLTQDLVCNNISVNTLSCKNLLSNNNLVSYLFNNNITYPIMKSGLLSNLTNLNLSLPIYVTLAQNTTFILSDINGIILFSLTNTTSDYIYYSTISYNAFYTPYNFELFNN